MTTKSEHNIWYAIDFETSSTNRYSCKIAGVGVCVFDIETGKVRSTDYYDEHSFHLMFSYGKLDAPCVFHGGSFDLYLLHRACHKLELSEVHDTYLMAKHFRNDWPAYGLKFLSWYLWADPYLELARVRNWLRAHESNDDEFTMDLSLPPAKLVGAYCIKDVVQTAKLACEFWPHVKDNPAYHEDRRFLPSVVDIESWGLHADVEFYSEYKRKGGRRAKYNRTKAAERMGTERNPMGDALRDHLHDLGETRTTATGKTQADDVVLRDWKKKDSVMGSVGRVRKDEKNISTYVDNILAVVGEDGIFHPHIMQSSAITRRARSAGFYGDNGVQRKGNIQNFPPVMREGITARQGYDFYVMDLSSIEARMFSAFMELLMDEDTFAEMYRKDPDFSPYLLVVERCTHHGKITKSHELYMPYKHGTLGRLYGSSAKRFSIQLRDDFELDYSIRDCEAIYASIDREFPFIRRFQRMVTQIIEDQGYIMDPFGAVYYIPESEAYKGVAHVCQGCAGGVLKWWGNRIVPMMKKADDHIANQVHDEYDVEAHHDRGTLGRMIRYAYVLRGLDLFDLPIRADVKGPLPHWRGDD